MTRYSVLRVASCLLALSALAGCGTEKSATTASVEDAPLESLDGSDLNENLATSLINGQLPHDNCADLNTTNRGWRREAPDQSLVGFTPGQDSLPGTFHLAHTAMMTKFNGLEQMIDAGILTATHIRDYEKEEDGGFGSIRKKQYFVYRIDFSEAARSSPLFRINENQSLSNSGSLLARICLGPMKANNVRYVLPGDNSVTSAEFSWNIEITDPFVQSVMNAGFWQNPPRLNGTGNATLAKTNAGWQATNVQH